jgi:hypothetical protein
LRHTFPTLLKEGAKRNIKAVCISVFWDALTLLSGHAEAMYLLIPAYSKKRYRKLFSAGGWSQ